MVVCIACGGRRDLRCLNEQGDPFCTFVPRPSDNARASAPNGNSLCVPCGNNGRPLCLGARPLPP